MKKLFLPLLLAAVLFPAAIQAKEAREIVKLTRFQGERIIGVSASGQFEVKLVKALEPDGTRAIVELDIELEPYLKFEKKGNGTVEVGLNELPRDLQRKYNGISRSDMAMKLTLYLAELECVSLSGASFLWTLEERDYTFGGEKLSIKTSGAAAIRSLFADAAEVSVECSGASSVRLKTHLEKLTVLSGGSARADVRSYGSAYTKVTAGGASGVTLRGDAVEASLNGAGSAKIRGDEFKTQDAVVSTAGAAQVSLSVSNSLRATASGSSRISYKGNPRQMNASNSGAGAVKAL